MKKSSIFPACIAFDFDHTLFHFKGEYSGLFDIFVSKGIPEKEAVTAYQKVRTSRSGFTITSLQKELERKYRTEFDSKKIRREFHAWLSSSFLPYPDTRAFIKRAKARFPLAVITTGNPAFQKSKVAASKVAFAQEFYVRPGSTKAKAMRRLLRIYGGSIVYVDDKATELDAIRDAGLQEASVITVHLVRRDSPYKKIPARHPHRTGSTLRFLSRLLGFSA